MSLNINVCATISIRVIIPSNKNKNKNSENRLALFSYRRSNVNVDKCFILHSFISTTVSDDDGNMMTLGLFPKALHFTAHMAHFYIPQTPSIISRLFLQHGKEAAPYPAPPPKWHAAAGRGGEDDWWCCPKWRRRSDALMMWWWWWLIYPHPHLSNLPGIYFSGDRRWWASMHLLWLCCCFSKSMEDVLFLFVPFRRWEMCILLKFETPNMYMMNGHFVCISIPPMMFRHFRTPTNTTNSNWPIGVLVHFISIPCILPIVDAPCHTWTILFHCFPYQMVTVRFWCWDTVSCAPGRQTLPLFPCFKLRDVSGHFADVDTFLSCWCFDVLCAFLAFLPMFPFPLWPFGHSDDGVGWKAFGICHF